MKKLLLLFAFIIRSFATPNVEGLTWDNGDALLKFLQKDSIPISSYYGLDREDQELASDIACKVEYQVLRDENNNIEQVLIPTSDDLQIHIYKDRDNQYTLTFSPISYQKEDRILHLTIKNSAYQDVYKGSGSSTLAHTMVRFFRGSVNFHSIQKGDKITLYYKRKKHMGKLWEDIAIKMAVVEINKSAQEIFAFSDISYDRDEKEVEAFLLAKPIGYTRISSTFNTAGYHPMLERYRTHLDIDYTAPTGTPVKSTGRGTITFVDTKGGYGNVTQVKHDSGYVTLYAHLSRFAKIKKGQKVSQGQLIGYVGSTDMSTSPHLHFGVYLNNKAINPASVVEIAGSELSGKAKEESKSVIVEYGGIINEALAANKPNPPKKEDSENYIEF